MAFGANLCFLNARGGFLRRNCFRSEYWLRAVRKAGIPGLRVHDMRHSAISWWANSGIPAEGKRRNAALACLAMLRNREPLPARPRTRRRGRLTRQPG